MAQLAEQRDIHSGLRHTRGIRRHQQRIGPPPTRYVPISDNQAQELVRALEKIEFLGGQEKTLIAEMSRKINILGSTCAAIRKHLKSVVATSSKIVPIETLDGGLKLRRPIHAVIERSEGIVTATYYECEVFGEGDSEFEALDDLRCCIVEHYRELCEFEHSLGPLPTRHLQILKDLIREE